MIRVLLVDDHVVLHESLKWFLERRGGIAVVAVVATGHMAVERDRDLTPDVVVMDLMLLADMSGIEATRRICAAAPGRRVIGFSAVADLRVVRALFRAGACGYVMKACPHDDLIGAVQWVAAGNTYLSPGLPDGLDVAQPRPGDVDLSSRERQILKHIAAGRTTKDIAFIFGLSDDAIEYHRKRMLAKLDMQSIAELTKYAIRVGLAALDQ